MKYNADLIGNKAAPLAVKSHETNHPQKKLRGRYPLSCLVVDDDRIIIKIVAKLLTAMGVRKVDTAENKPELMNRLATGPYDLVVTDLMMPDMNGYQLTQMIKKEMRYTKVIIMTGRHKDECQEMMATRWVDGWLFKPFGPKGLYNMMNRLGLFGCVGTANTYAHHAPAIQTWNATDKGEFK